MYKNKILGLRGKSTGLVFSNFDRNKHVITKEQAKTKKYARIVVNENDKVFLWK